MYFTRDAYMASLQAGKVRLEYPDQPVVDQAAAATVRERVCPSCLDRVMLVKQVGTIEIDACQKCKGIWLDAGEFEAILERKRENEGGNIIAPAAAVGAAAGAAGLMSDPAATNSSNSSSSGEGGSGFVADVAAESLGCVVGFIFNSLDF